MRKMASRALLASIPSSCMLFCSLATYGERRFLEASYGQRWGYVCPLGWAGTDFGCKVIGPCASGRAFMLLPHAYSCSSKLTMSNHGSPPSRRVGKVRPPAIQRPLSMRIHRRGHERASPSPRFRERFPSHPPSIKIHVVPLVGPSSPSWGLRDTARVVDGETSVENTLDGRFFSTGEETPSYPVGPRLPPAQRLHGGSLDSHACVSARISTLRGARQRPPFPVGS